MRIGVIACNIMKRELDKSLADVPEVAKVIFLEAAADDVCETSYRDRGGKYQGQVGVTLPKI